MKYILTDVEGTTTSISFVHDELFPFSKKRINDFVFEKQHHPEVKKILDTIPGSIEEKIAKLISWIEEDKKEKPLKDLQGLIWEEGYLTGEIKGHVYEDVLPNLVKWKNAGINIGIYSSGSIQAQKLLFKHSIMGDLDTYFSNNFDTNIGHKREVSSYQNIVRELKLNPSDILFLSDIKEELDAAKLAGLSTLQLIRKDDVITGDHKTIKSFDEIEF